MSVFDEENYDEDEESLFRIDNHLAIWLSASLNQLPVAFLMKGKIVTNRPRLSAALLILFLLLAR